MCHVPSSHPPLRVNPGLVRSHRSFSGQLGPAPRLYCQSPMRSNPCWGLTGEMTASPNGVLLETRPRTFNNDARTSSAQGTCHTNHVKLSVPSRSSGSTPETPPSRFCASVGPTTISPMPTLVHARRTSQPRAPSKGSSRLAQRFSFQAARQCQ